MINVWQWQFSQFRCKEKSIKWNETQCSYKRSEINELDKAKIKDIIVVIIAKTAIVRIIVIVE